MPSSCRPFPLRFFCVCTALHRTSKLFVDFMDSFFSVTHEQGHLRTIPPKKNLIKQSVYKSRGVDHLFEVRITCDLFFAAAWSHLDCP